MKSAIQCLKTADIKALLAGTVPASQSELWEEHFSTCESCRMAMSSHVGDQEWWREAEQSLMRESIPEVRDSVKNEGDERESHEELLKLLGPTDDPQMLGRIGSYEVLGVLGRGGMGVVFKAFDAPLNRFVAIKMLLPHLAASGAARKRFAREGQAVAAVVDDHVMAIHCVDEWRGVPYLVMTYSRGVSLQKRLSDNGPLEVREILRIGMQAAKGLAAAHAQGIVHRDIKPANIFLDQTVERVQLMDFGLARAVDDASLTRSGTLAGTPQYMSPEQARAETVDHRSDLFSLGSVMYAMCTGHPPFRAESSYSVLRLITDKEPRPICELNPEVPTWLCAIISKLMSKQADDRFESAEQIAELLKKCLAHLQSPLTSTLPVELRSLPGGQDFCRSKAKLGRSLALPHEDWRGIFQAATRLKVVFAMCCLSFVAVLLFNQYAAPPQSKNDSAVALESGAQNANVPASEPVAVVMVMHPAELRNGNTIQRAAATKTLGLLSDNDYCGILRYGYSKSEANWLWGDGTELQKVGANRKDWLAAIAESKTGDFPTFEPAFKMALNALTKLNASQKLMLVFTDGDPVLVDETLIEQFRAARIRVSVVHVDIHRIKERALLKRLSEATGGTYHYALESQAAVVETLFVLEVQALRTDNKAALQKIGFAFHMVHDKIGRFPGSRMKHLDRQDKEFGHPFSWRVAILPYIGQQQLFDEYRFDEPWDSDKNILLLKKMPDIYRSPHAPADQPLGNSNMQGFATDNGGLGLNAGEAMSSFTDGTSNTILIVETAQSVPWTQPVDLTERTVQPIAGQPLRFVLADGSVGEVNPIDASRLEKLITRNGGETIENVPSNKPDELETGKEAKRHADKQDAVIANLQALLKLQKLREESVRQLSLIGSIRQLQKIETQRNEGESNEDFIARYTSRPAEFDQLGPFPMSVLRDYTKDLGHIKYGDINVPFPMYREWFFRGDMFTELMGSGQGRCQAKITQHPSEELKQPWSGWLRADVFAMRPIRDHSMSLTLEKAAFTPGLPDLGGRPLFQLKKQETADKKASWIATFLHQEPTVKDGRKAAEQLWFRVHWEQLENELIIKRVDELSVVGNADSMPRTVTLLEEYRKIEGVSLPHRTRVFMFGISGILGAQFDATEIKVNDGVVVPTELSIPEGTSVRDEVNNKKYRQPAVDKP